MALSVQVVRFGRDAARALRAHVAMAQAGDPLAPVTVVVSRSTVGLAARRLLASGVLEPAGAERRGVANVTFVTLGHLADRLGGPVLARAGRRPATHAVVHAAIRASLAATPGGLFGPVRTHPATERAVATIVRDLRAATPETLVRLAELNERTAEVTVLAADVRRRLAGWYDEHDLLDAALGVVAAEPATVAGLGPVVVHLPGSLPPRHEQLVIALGEATPVTVVLGATGDATADASTAQLAERLAPGSWPTAATPAAHATEVVNAPSADAEVLVAVRGVARRHAEGVPLDRMAVLHGGADPYPRLVHEALERAGLPDNGSGVRPLSATLVGRTLLGALALPDHDWRRDDVVAWLAGAPIRFRGEPVPATAWDLASRQAGVTAGLDTWTTHLTASADALEATLAELAEPEGDEVPEWRRRRAERDLEHTRSLGEFVAELSRTLDPAAAPTSWAGWAEWASRLLRDHLGTHHAWPADEEQALTEVANVLSGLATLDALDPDPDPATFRRALAAELDVPAPRTSRFGHGVLVGPVEAAVGLDLDVVFVVGMVEGVFPARPRDDALVPDGERAAAGDELPLRGSRAAESHRAYLAALATAPERVISFARGDQRRGREQRPSPWLLESVAALAGGERRLFSRDLPELGGVPGYQLVPSLTAAIRAPGEPAALGDRDLRSLLVWGERTGHLDGHILVDLDAVLGTGLQARRQRSSPGFTRFDGRVQGVDVPSPAGGEALSPTSLQDYATCPRRYLLGKVLRLSAPERPEDIQRISARDKGTLVHLVLERFMGEQVARPRDERIPPHQRWTADDRALLDAIASAAFAEFEQRGLTGRTLLWELDRAAIRRDLHAFLLADDLHRDRSGVVPEQVELAFGPGRGEPVEIELAGGRRLTFRGFADRVDLAPDGESVVVLDYKTGGDRAYRELSADDPVARGTLLQLPIYGLAARSRFGAVPVHTQYWFVTEKGGFRSVGYDLSEGVLGRLHDTLETMVDGIEHGLFPARPGEPDRSSFDNCRYCDFDPVCPAQRDREWDRVRDDPDLAAYVALSEGGES